MAAELTEIKLKRGSDFARAKRMVHVAEVLYTFGVSKTALAHQAGIGRVALSNKFAWAEAIIKFEVPRHRDTFTEEDEELVMATIEKMAVWLAELLEPMRAAEQHKTIEN